MQRFEEEGMLYLVPQGADDDWYWIYSTVAENRKSVAYVVRTHARPHVLTYEHMSIFAGIAMLI